jgi:hypothetical protein
MVHFDLYELAWAAGFYDGEGCTYADVSPTGNVLPRIAITQVDPRPLTRFRDAAGFGTIAGPRYRKNPKHAPFFFYSLDVFEHVQAVIAMLWKYLSEPKREQAAKVLMDARVRGPQYMTKDSPVCKRGHPMVGPDASVRYFTYKSGTPARICRRCAAMGMTRVRERKEKEAEMLRHILEQPWTQR